MGGTSYFDKSDYQTHMNDVHINPIKHGLVS